MFRDYMFAFTHEYIILISWFIWQTISLRLRPLQKRLVSSDNDNDNDDNEYIFIAMHT